MDTNYQKNMQTTYDALMGNVETKTPSAMECMSAYIKLKEKFGNELYFDGKQLRAKCTNPGVSASVIEYLENRDLVKKNQNESSAFASIVEGLARE